MTWPTLHELVVAGATGWHRCAPPSGDAERWVYLDGDQVPRAAVHDFGPVSGAVWWHPPLGPGNAGATWCATVAQAKAEAVPS